MINTQKKLDFLNLSDKIGKVKSFFIYSFMIFAVFNLLTALILILVPMNDPEMQNNNLMIFSKRQWLKESDLQKEIMNNQIVLQVTDQFGKLANSNKNINQKLASLTMISKAVPIQTSDYFGNSQISHQWNFSSRQEEISFSFYMNEIKDTTQLSLTKNDGSQLSVKVNQEVKFNIRDMIAQGMCHDTPSCTANCLKNNNQIKTEENEVVCEGTFQVTQICAVMDFNEKNIIGGCYKNGQYEKYSFVQAPQVLKKKIQHESIKGIEPVEISFEIYDKHDPHVKALEISQTYEPYEQIISPYQKASKYFFLLGGSISVILLFILAVVNAGMNEKEKEKEQEQNQSQEMVFDPTSISQFN